MKIENYNKGKNGEDMAREFLVKKGYELVVFVEVKLKVGDKFGIPEEMIDKRKLSQIKRVAESFLILENKIAKKFKKYRIDALCIVLNEVDKEIERINHYENI
ncbi:MAG: YraN family protein [Candidatus Shapirobacteria bacterium]